VTLLINADRSTGTGMAYRLDCTIKHRSASTNSRMAPEQFEVLKRNISEIVDQPQEDRKRLRGSATCKQSLYQWRAGNPQAARQPAPGRRPQWREPEPRPDPPLRSGGARGGVNAVLDRHVERGSGQLHRRRLPGDSE
jgi:hypothetical protein